MELTASMCSIRGSLVERRSVPSEPALKFEGWRACYHFAIRPHASLRIAVSSPRQTQRRQYCLWVVPLHVILLANPNLPVNWHNPRY